MRRPLPAVVAVLVGALLALTGLAVLATVVEPPSAGTPAPPVDGAAAERDLSAALDRGEDPTGPADPPASPAEPRD